MLKKLKASNNIDNSICATTTSTATVSTSINTSTTTTYSSTSTSTKSLSKTNSYTTTTSGNNEKENKAVINATSSFEQSPLTTAHNRQALVERLLPFVAKEVVLGSLSEEEAEQEENEKDQEVPTTSNKLIITTIKSNNDLINEEEPLDDNDDDDENKDDVDFDDDIIPFDACEYEKIVCCSTSSTVNLNNRLNSATSGYTSRLLLIIITSKSCNDLNDHFKRSTE